MFGARTVCFLVATALCFFGTVHPARAQLAGENQLELELRRVQAQRDDTSRTLPMITLAPASSP